MCDVEDDFDVSFRWPVAPEDDVGAFLKSARSRHEDDFKVLKSPGFKILESPDFKMLKSPDFKIWMSPDFKIWMSPGYDGPTG
jgi:hypothetical protein